VDVYVFADERKKIVDRWDYIGLALVAYADGQSLYDDLQRERRATGFEGEMKFSSLHKKGIGSRVDTVLRWLRLIIDDSQMRRRRLYFSVTGIDNTMLDFRLFGPDGTPRGKYANVYNRFFRASLRGMLNYCFNSETITVRRIFHDTEGNLEQHDYFDWHLIREIAHGENRISFGDDRVRFVHSDTRKEKEHPRASEMIQLVDLLLGTITYAIHVTNPANRGQLKCAKLLLPWVREVLGNPYDPNGVFDQLRRFSVSHFPKHHQHRLNEGALPGEYYQPSCSRLESVAFGQAEFSF